MIQPVVRTKRYRYVFFALAAFSSSYGFFHYVAPALSASWMNFSTGQKAAMSAQYCSLGKEGCEIAGRHIKLDRNIIKPMEPAKVQVSWPSLPSSTKALELTLEGSEMMMGTYRLSLHRQSDTDEFSGELMLPFCVSEEMTWVGQITPATSNSQQAVYISVRMMK
ncbi:hypothetical protein C9J03_06920 [Photobacterium gaetbulicola]|uniref:hypothetical protein n=1 Tax=Photobacterium gaetbulicola TaxID=1295392 RepID=UPI00069ACD98|nr:hypothetical protein [Photobacterium gaetbulicola]PSU13194.1 hypothetical protein C9J03_06920 [Photobacterium gaetbulicola]